MNLVLQGRREDISRVEEGTRLLLEEMKPGQGEADLNIQLKVEFRKDPELLICREGEKAEIYCQEPAHYFRALTWLGQHTEEKKYSRKERVYFSGNGLMLDCSRNSVFTVEKVKELIRILARFGLNRLLLYTEDTYEIIQEPYFGAYRGRYTQAEIREMDQYAMIFGVELIPCIQTLAHLHNALKWPLGNEVKDTPDILQVGKETTYHFIEEMLTAVRDSFHTKRVHLGMDEAVQLGLGNYLKDNGYTQSSLLMKEHCRRVLDICKKLGLEPMIWSDMYITSNTGGGYYEVEEGTDCSTWEKSDPDLGLVYWDYYNTDEKVYEKMLRVHAQLGKHTVFAGGCWIWNGIAPNYSRSFICTKAALAMCKKYQIKEVFCTAWMDNGAETPVDTILPGAALFAYLGFHDKFEEKTFAEEFEMTTGVKLNDFLKLDKFDRLFLGEEPNIRSENPSKYLLYQDALLGIFDAHLKEVQAKGYYRQLAKELKSSEKNAGRYQTLFAYYRYLAEILADKAELGVCIKKAYDEKNLSTLKQICEEDIPRITENMWKLKEFREELWMKDAKPFGFELLDLRMGGVIIRLESCKKRLLQYIQGEIDKLEELEENRLPYFGEKEARIENRWQRTISGADLTDTI